MGLETVTGIADLVITNPVGATDPKSQGDDHIRNIKKALKHDFPNIAGIVTPTHTELNYVDGVTSAIQTQLDGKAATSHVHSAADLTSGTVPDARFPATLPALNGSALTALNASNLGSGTVADARLSANVPLLNAGNVFTGIPQKVSGTNAYWDATDGSVTAFLQAAGGSSLAVVGSATSHPLAIRTNNSPVCTFAVDGSITTNNTVAGEAGFKGLPTATDETPVLTDAGKIIVAAGNVTIPANSSIAFPVGTVLTVVNNTAGTITIAVTSDTLRWAGTGGTDGTRTLASHQGVATLLKTGSTLWVISGNLT